MKVMAQLAFNGVCRQAFQHYAEVLGGKIVVMNTFGGNDARLPPGSVASAPEHIRFARLEVAEGAILGNDVPPHQHEPMQGFNLALHLESVDEAERIFSALGEGGDISTPLAEVPWAKRFGMLRDHFGVPWLVLALDGGNASR
ncbi:MAG: VOC family protein [Rhizobacter sp.]